tara:strand:- start:446 stop:754 length:309 start_codon:yes stop_codon:yes gene_type:complete
MERAVSFYQDAMGLPVKFQDGTKWVQFDAGGTNFSLSSPDEAAEGAMGAVLIFEVDSIADASITIKKNGGEVLDSRDMGHHGRVLSFRDPDGHLVQLFQRGG